MTRDEILAMEAGPETNVLVAQTVMGLDVCTEHDGWPGEWCRECQRHWAEDYSGKIAPAWKVLEKLQDERLPSVFHDGQLWVCGLTDLRDPFIASANTAPHAISLAALLLEVEDD